jgi:hypothetical protein
MAKFNPAEKLAANEAHKQVRKARDDLRELLSGYESRERHWEEVIAWLPEVLKLLERAEGNIDVVLGRPRS